MAKNFKFRLERFGGFRSSLDRSLELTEGESPEMSNFKITPGRQLKKREGYEAVLRGEGFRGIWYGTVEGETQYLAVKGRELFSSREGFREMEAVSGAEIDGEGEVFFFPFHGALYLLTGESILKYDGERVEVPQPYIPLVMIATAPDGAGTLYEEVNLLTRRVRQSFSPTGLDRFFTPAISEVVTVEKAWLQGEELPTDSYFWDPMTQSIAFLAAPPKGVDTLEVQYLLEREDSSKRILGCRRALGFGGANDTRAFLYGNPACGAVRYHSAVVEGKPCMEYFPETGYTLIGSGAPITSILRHYDRQLIFTADAAYYSYLEYLTGTSDSLIAAFPVLPLSDERGNVPSGQALLVENDPFTLTEAGLCRWISTNVRDERNAVLVSSAISAALQREDTERARMFHRKRTSELYLWFDTVLYVYHCGLNLFYRYEIPSILGFCQGKEELYFFTAEGIFRVGGNTDDGKEIRARWVSRILPFGSLSRYKRLYRTTVYLEGEEGGSVQILLKKDGASEKTTLSFSPTDTVTARSFRTRLGRFCYLQIALETEGNTPLHCFGLELQGRETDLIRKE